MRLYGLGRAIAPVMCVKPFTRDRSSLGVTRDKSPVGDGVPTLKPNRCVQLTLGSLRRSQDLHIRDADGRIPRDTLGPETWLTHTGAFAWNGRTET